MTPPPRESERIVVTNPDPTVAVKEALELAIKNLDDKIDRRFRGIDQATELAREELKDKLQALKETIINAANARAEANKDLVEKLEKSNQAALNAALLTQKESASKSEVAMADIIRQLQVSFDTAIKVVNEKIDRLTSRLDLGGVDDNRRIYREDVRDTTRAAVDHRAFIAALVAIAIAAAAVYVSLGLHR